MTRMVYGFTTLASFSGNSCLRSPLLGAPPSHSPPPSTTLTSPPPQCSPSPAHVHIAASELVLECFIVIMPLLLMVIVKMMRQAKWAGGANISTTMHCSCSCSSSALCPRMILWDKKVTLGKSPEPDVEIIYDIGTFHRGDGGRYYIVLLLGYNTIGNWDAMEGWVEHYTAFALYHTAGALERWRGRHMPAAHASSQLCTTGAAIG